jgi:hypothetical protein
MRFPGLIPPITQEEPGGAKPVYTQDGTLTQPMRWPPCPTDLSGGCGRGQLESERKNSTLARVNQTVQGFASEPAAPSGRDAEHGVN